VPDLPRHRLVVIGLVWGLLLATTVAFVATEALKLERPPVGAMRGDRALSPTCGCPKRVAELSFRLKKADTVDVEIVEEDGDQIRALATEERLRRGRAGFRWNGRDDAGELVPDGTYRLRVHLADADRTTTFSRRIRVDTEPPTVELLAVAPSTIEPGGEAELRVELSEPARVFVRANGRRAGRLGRVEAGVREASWSNTAGLRSLEPGSYRLALVAVDPAGNRSSSTEAVEVTLADASG
jgi:FlgD Ig-like domain